MREEQIYNPVAGINRMMADMEDFLNPIVAHLHPMFRVASNINIGLVIVVFAVLLFYMVFVRRHSVMSKLREPSNYFAACALLIIYAFFTETPVKIGPELSLNFGLIVMPLAAKLFGPIIAGAFGIIQYATSFVMHQGESFNLSAMLVAGISGMLYGWVIYARRTSYIRCLWAKLMVNVVCNILLVPMAQGTGAIKEIANSITQSIVSNIIMAPIQALLIFVALIIMKKIRKDLSRVSWGLDR